MRREEWQSGAGGRSPHICSGECYGSSSYRGSLVMRNGGGGHVDFGISVQHTQALLKDTPDF